MSSGSGTFFTLANQASGLVHVCFTSTATVTTSVSHEPLLCFENQGSRFLSLLGSHGLAVPIKRFLREYIRQKRNRTSATATERPSSSITSIPCSSRTIRDRISSWCRSRPLVSTCYLIVVIASNYFVPLNTVRYYCSDGCNERCYEQPPCARLPMTRQTMLAGHDCLVRLDGRHGSGAYCRL